MWAGGRLTWDHATPLRVGDEIQRASRIVSVTHKAGRTLYGRVDEPKGDPGNMLSREEITAKALQLAAFSGGASDDEMRAAVERLWQVAQWPAVPSLLPA